MLLLFSDPAFSSFFVGDKQLYLFLIITCSLRFLLGFDVLYIILVALRPSAGEKSTTFWLFAWLILLCVRSFHFSLPCCVKQDSVRGYDGSCMITSDIFYFFSVFIILFILLEHMDGARRLYSNQTRYNINRSIR